MPNHIHGIIEINNDITGKPQPLAEIVRQFKTFSAKRINKLCGTGGNKIWQRNYYEHVIRSEQACSKIAEYIETNPLKWPDDKYHV